MKNKAKTILITGVILAGSAVFIGAFGAHSLKETLLDNNKTQVFETGVKYQFYHSFGLICIGILSFIKGNKWYNRAFYTMTTGTVFFSVSLYLLSILNINILGIITPIGGMLLIISWLLVILGIKKAVPDNL